MMTATGHDSVLIVPTNGAVVPSILWTRLHRVFAVTDFEREAEILYLLEDDDEFLLFPSPGDSKLTKFVHNFSPNIFCVSSSNKGGGNGISGLDGTINACI